MKPIHMLEACAIAVATEQSVHLNPRVWTRDGSMFLDACPPYKMDVGHRMRLAELGWTWNEQLLSWETPTMKARV